jgi:hypothetical protein
LNLIGLTPLMSLLPPRKHRPAHMIWNEDTSINLSRSRNLKS